MSVPQSSIDKVEALFIDKYRYSPAYVSAAPGRIEILGNHTDYNLGYVMSAAIDRYTMFAIARTDSSICNVYSDSQPEPKQFDLNSITRDAEPSWEDYIKGVVVELQKQGVGVPGFDAVLTSNVPLGAGLSSSAALEVSCCLALLAISDVDWTPWKIAEAGKAAENNFVGMPCGILDQFSSTFGTADAMMWLDTRTKQYEACYLPSTPRLELCLVNSMGVHALTEGKYADRFAECKSARDWFAKFNPEAQELRDVTLCDFLANKEGLDDILMRRAKHIVTENQRVLDAKIALEKGDVESLGRLMYESHISSSTDFDNSTSGLDLLVGLAKKHHALGARLMGGGWGGAVICLVPEDIIGDFELSIAADYKKATGLQPSIFRTVPAQGAQIFKL